MNAWYRVEDRTQEVHNVSLLFRVLIEAFEEICLVIAPKQALYLIDSTFGKLGDELLPVAMFDFEEASEVVGLEEHETDEAAV